MSIKLGIIGLSNGNGHPYSWSSIFNGYSTKEIAKCPFPVIPKYLSEQKWPESKISNAEVKGIWTQSEEISKSIARFSLIENIYLDIKELIYNSDLILLARDDAENHYENAYHALKYKKPIFIDKPIALSIKDLEKIYKLSTNPRQIFSCSAMSFCPAFSKLTKCFEDEELGSIELISPKTWDKYSVHLIDPLIKYLRESYLNDYSLEIFDIKFLNKETSINCFLKTLKQKHPVKIKITTTGESNGQIGFYAFNKNKKLIRKEFHNQTFLSFKGALEKFIKINSRNFEGYSFDYNHHYKVVEIIQAPRKI